jgi:SAM-dependent methyltransferase
MNRKRLRILDYGCGKGRLARRFAALGHEVVAYDPDPALKPHLEALQTSAIRGVLSVPTDRFDVVVCELVLCTIEDGPVYESILTDLRRLVRDDGRVIVAVCNPAFTLGGDTPLQHRILSPDACIERVFVWEKIHAATGARRRDVHRPIARLRRDFLRAGLAVESVRETETVDLERFEPASDFIVFRLRPLPDPAPVTLMIKTCAMEWRTIEAQVKHLVGQLEEPVRFAERLLVIDSRTTGFTRGYAAGDPQQLAAAAERLLREGWIDRLLQGPAEPAAVSGLNTRWFGIPSPATHAANGSPIAATLAGFEACRTTFVLQLDSDALVLRRDRRHDYLGEMIGLLEGDAQAVTASLNIVQDIDRPWTAEGPDGPWRVEVRAAMIHLPRLFAARPLPNEPDADTLKLAWYRAADLAVRRDGLRSYRGGASATGYVHPPNDLKRDPDEWLLLMDRLEHGFIPPGQSGQFDAVVPLGQWLSPKRAEPFVFVITGRNVPPGRFRRCLQSVFTQRRRDWGAVVIDDGSDEEIAEHARRFCAERADRVTFLRSRLRRGQLANIVCAIRHVCVNPESVIVTLDADDALLGPGVLDRVYCEYERGADVTVGSMLRTDKHVEYPADLADPRGRRGGNVWQHLRTFKKRLFDAVPDEALRLDGKYVDVATDWAFMIPIVELASKPVYIRDPLYLYEPSGHARVPAREEIIARIMAKPSMRAATAEKGHVDA